MAKNNTEILKIMLKYKTEKHHESLKSDKRNIEGIKYKISICDFFGVEIEGYQIELHTNKIKQIIIEYPFDKMNFSNSRNIKTTIDSIANEISNKYPDHKLKEYKGNYKPYQNLLIHNKFFK